jgi:formamidopyrimidine-DNA glycosylase
MGDFLRVIGEEREREHMNIASAHVIKNHLNEAVCGKRIVNVIANQNPHTFVWFAFEPSRAFTSDKVYIAEATKDIATYMTGKIIEKIGVNTGGYGLFDFIYLGDRALLSDITPRYTPPGAKYAKKHQLLLEFEDSSHLTYTASLGGALFLFKVDENGVAIGYKSDFPMINTDAFNYDYFKSIISREKGTLSVKQLLATKNRIPGIDNSLLQDILWEAQMNPKRKIDTLGEDDFKRIFAAIKSVPSAIINAGGKDVDKDIYGNYGGYESRASRNTLGQPCARCGNEIVKESYLGGSVFYCPKCQK